MPRSVLMQHHALHRTTRSLTTVGSTPLGALQKTARLQEGLRPCVTPPEPVIAHQVLMEMLRRKTYKMPPVKLLHALCRLSRHLTARRLPQPTIHKTSLSILLKAMPPSPERPLPHPQKLGSLHAAQLARFVAIQNTPQLHHPHTLKGFCPAHPNSQKGDTRSPDRSCAT